MVNSFPYLLLITLVIVSLVMPCFCADPSPLQDYCIADLSSGLYLNGYPCKNPSNVSTDDFFYEGFINDTRGYDADGMKASGAHVDSFPAVNTLGIAMIQIEVLAGGAVPPHVHPRGTELLLLSKGIVIAGFITTDNVLFYKTMTPKMLVVMPQALVHFIYNVGNETALLYASFNSQQPGTTYIPHSVFNSTLHIPTEVLTRSFRVNDSIVELIESNLSVPLFPEITTGRNTGTGSTV